MVERRKIGVRHVYPPRQGLPFYYPRYAADRRASVQTSWCNNRKDGPQCSSLLTDSTAVPFTTKASDCRRGRDTTTFGFPDTAG